MDHFPSTAFGQDSPPYRPEREQDNIPFQFSVVADSELNVWDTLSLITPPLTPVDTTSNDKEVIGHLSSQERRTILDLPEELFSCGQELYNERGASPAILNDIMWNAGQKHKRPDSAMEIDVRFNLNGTPLSFEQPITSTFVETADLFSFSLFENSADSVSESQHDEQPKDNNGITHFQDLSDSEEEIDVVSIQAETKPECKPTSPSHQTMDDTREKPKIILQRVKDMGEDVVSSDSECEVTRISHNDLERKRRNELRNRFNCLRECVPSISSNDKAAKITILRKASELIPVLRKEEKKLLAEKELERRRNAELLKKLSKFSTNL